MEKGSVQRGQARIAQTKRKRMKQALITVEPKEMKERNEGKKEEREKGENESMKRMAGG